MVGSEPVVRSRLAFKVSVLIVVVLILGFGASTILTIQRESALLLEQNKMAARRLTATLVASIEGAMLQERPDVTRTVLQELKTSSPVEGLTIFRRTGVEAFTDLVTAMEVDKNAGLAKDVMDNIRKMARPPGETATGPMFTEALQSLRTQESLETAQRRHLLHAALSDPQPGKMPGLPRRRPSRASGGPGGDLDGAGAGRGAPASQPADPDRPGDDRGRGLAC